MRYVAIAVLGLAGAWLSLKPLSAVQVEAPPHRIGGSETATDAAAVEGSATKMEGSETKAETEVDAAVDAAQGSVSKMEATADAEGSAPKTEGSEIK